MSERNVFGRGFDSRRLHHYSKWSIYLYPAHTCNVAEKSDIRYSGVLFF
jgi:hypothetical protein